MSVLAYARRHGRESVAWYGGLGLLTLRVMRNLRLPPSYLVLVAQEIFEEDLDGEGEARDLADAALPERLQAEDPEGVSADGLARKSPETVWAHGVPTSPAVSLNR